MVTRWSVNILRQVVHKIKWCTSEHPCVRFEKGLSVPLWLEKQHVMDWSGGMEVRLLAIALYRDIVVIVLVMVVMSLWIPSFAQDEWWYIYSY